MAETAPTDIERLGREAWQALRREDPGAARPLFEAVVAGNPVEANAWFGLALACLGLGDTAGQLAALDQVLAAEPRHLPALLMKADHFARIGNNRSAHAFYRAAVARAPALETLPPDLRDAVRRAERQSAEYARTFESHLLDAVSKAGFDPAKSSRRFAQSLDLMLGRKQIYLQSPTSFYFPELPQRQFYERNGFSWLENLESKTDLIRGELLDILQDDESFQPYMRTTSLRPPGTFGNLVDNPDWSAFYLIESGVVDARAAERCPRTMEALGDAPLACAPGRTPSVLFSLLRPRTRIQAHTGQINARLICHLPLIVPAGCGLRVGNEVRSWVEGEALIFDDTIEHEAWNDSEQLRVVLLFDIWRPELSLEERELVAALLAAVGAYDTASS